MMKRTCLICFYALLKVSVLHCLHYQVHDVQIKFFCRSRKFFSGEPTQKGSNKTVESVHEKTNNLVATRSDTNHPVQYRSRLEAGNFRFRAAKTKALISCAVTAPLFSHRQLNIASAKQCHALFKDNSQ